MAEKDERLGPQFTHDCDRCVFHGRGNYQKDEIDWYTCQNEGRTRTLIARYGNDGPRYISGEIGICMEVTHLEMSALAHGLELMPVEQERLLKILLRQRREAISSASRERYDSIFPYARTIALHNGVGISANWLSMTYYDEPKQKCGECYQGEYCNCKEEDNDTDHEEVSNG